MWIDNQITNKFTKPTKLIKPKLEKIIAFIWLITANSQLKMQLNIKTTLANE